MRFFTTRCGKACTSFLNTANWATTSGAAGFLYPFLGQEKQDTGDLVSQVAASIKMKVQDDSVLRSKWRASKPSRSASAAWRFTNAWRGEAS